MTTLAVKNSLLKAPGQALRDSLENGYQGGLILVKRLIVKRFGLMLDIGDWDVSRVQDFRKLFCNRAEACDSGVRGSFSDDISAWNTSAATDMSLMFWNNVNFNSDLGNWDVSRVRNFNGMFKQAATFDRPLTGWRPVSANDMEMMFSGASVFNQVRRAGAP